MSADHRHNADDPTKLSPCPGDLSAFTTPARVISSHSAVTIVVACFITQESREVFESALERVRRNYRLNVYGYVVMPEHVHLLLSEPQEGTLAVALKSLKEGVSRRLICDAGHFWQKQ